MDGTYKISVNVAYEGDTQTLVEALQWPFDHGMAGFFEVSNQEDGLKKITFIRNFFEDDVYIIPLMKKMANEGKAVTMKSAAFEQIALELLESTESPVLGMISEVIRAGRLEFDDTHLNFQKRQENLKPFIVTYLEDAGDKFRMAFECFAEDAEHAVDQAENANPGACDFIAAAFDWHKLNGAEGRGVRRIEQAESSAQGQAAIAFAARNPIRMVHRADTGLVFAVGAGAGSDATANDNSARPEAEHEQWLNQTLNAAVDQAFKEGCRVIQQALKVSPPGLDEAELSEHRLAQPLRAVLAQYMLDEIGKLMAADTADWMPEMVVPLGRWTVDHARDEDERIHVRRQGKPGFVSVIETGEGIVVDIYDDNDLPTLVSTTCVFNEDLSAQGQEG